MCDKIGEIFSTLHSWVLH